jgi:hypothetical protein
MSVEEFVNNSAILSISPNPVSSKSKVLFDSPFSGNYSISIIDINGNAIFSLFKGFLSSGINEFEFDAKTLSNGTYLIVASNLKTVYYSKISIIK